LVGCCSMRSSIEAASAGVHATPLTAGRNEGGTTEGARLGNGGGRGSDAARVGVARVRGKIKPEGGPECGRDIDGKPRCS
jgi:hypothetical protein